MAVKRFVLLCALVVVLPLSGASQPAQVVDPLDEIVSMVEQNLDKLGGNTLVVFPFPYADGIKSVEGALISERIFTTLTDRGKVRVVERGMLDKIMEEQKLSALGFVDPASSVEVGKLLGARGILSGTVTDIGAEIEIHVRLLSVETGEVVASMKRSTRKTIKTFISPIWSEIERIKKESPSFDLKFWADRGRNPTEIPGYRIGDFVALHFVAERDCYVTIFDFTTSGSIHVLFPNSFMPDNKIKGGREYKLPDEQAGFKIRVKGPPGIERLKLFATTKDIPLFEEDFSQESFRSVTSDDYSVPRDLEAVIDSLEKNAWAESHLELRVEQILRDTKRERESAGGVKD
jgi:TolB-like protein